MGTVAFPVRIFDKLPLWRQALSFMSRSSVYRHRGISGAHI
jgi:hypothetical protein